MHAPALTVSRRRNRSDLSSLAVEMGVKVGRDSLFYTIISTIIFPLGFANALVLTHYLSTTQYGQLSVLFVASGLTTVLLNLFFLRGTERRVWGSSDEGIDVDIAELIESHKRPRALGTGITLSVIFSITTIIVVIPFATPISRWLLHTPHLATAVVWAGASAGLGSVFRLAWNIVRWERRHVQFGIVYVLRPVLAIAITIPLVMNGAGVTGAVAGTALATLASSVYGLIVSRHSFVFVLERESAREILRSSMTFAMMLVGLYALHNGDVLLLSRYASQSQVGVYRLAGNITSLISYAVSAFLMAWAPLEHSNLFEAAYERHGRDRMRGEFLIYYLVMGLGLTLVLAALATPLAGLFSLRYAKAGNFVAITSLGWVAYGLLVVVARSSSFPRRYTVYGFAAIASTAGLIVTGIILGPPLGGYGVAIGDVVGGLVGVAVIAAVAGSLGSLPSVSLLRIGALLLTCGACYAIEAPLATHAGAWDPLLKLASVALYPVLLTVTGVVPVRHLGSLWAIVRKTFRSRSRPEALIERMAGLPSVERRMLLAIARDGESAARATVRTGIPEDTVRVRLVAALRRLADAGAPGEHDGAIGDYLLSTWSATQRDGAAREMWDVGVEPLELHRIESAFTALCSAPAKAWSRAVLRGGRDLPSGPWPIELADLELIDAAVRRRTPRKELAGELGLEPRELDRRLLGAVRALTTGGGPHPADALMASFLLDDSVAIPTAQLWAAGVDPLELHQLELTLAEIRSLPKERWREVVSDRRAVDEQRERLLEQVQP